MTAVMKTSGSALFDIGRRHPEPPDAVAGTRPEKEGLTMNMKEKLKIHSQIEADNERKLKEWKEGKDNGND